MSIVCWPSLWQLNAKAAFVALYVFVDQLEGINSSSYLYACVCIINLVLEIVNQVKLPFLIDITDDDAEANGHVCITS